MGAKKALFREPATRNGAVLTGCKNISPIKKLSEHRLLALDWDLEIELEREVGDAAFIGIRMHDVECGGGMNSFTARVMEEIENPFSFTVMLHKADSAGAQSIGWEMGKDLWRSIRAEILEINLPESAILLLKE